MSDKYDPMLEPDPYLLSQFLAELDDLRDEQARLKLLSDDWRKKWPNHCPACHGWGGHTGYQAHPYGSGVAREMIYDPCFHTELAETCHRCGQEGLDEDGEGPCRHCGWNWDDGDPLY